MIDTAPLVASQASATLSWSTSPHSPGATPRSWIARWESVAGSRSSPYAGEALQPVPERGERAGLGTQVQRVGVPSGGELVDHALPEVVVRQALGERERADGVEPPLEGLVLTGEPGLGPVDVRVDGCPELLVQRRDELGGHPPQRGRDQHLSRVTGSAALPGFRPPDRLEPGERATVRLRQGRRFGR